MPATKGDQRREGRLPKPDPDRQSQQDQKSINEEDRRREEAVRQREKDYEKFILRQKDRGDRNPPTAWLLLRYTPNDLGLRPILPGEAFWNSPDLWVESSDPLGNPVAGEPNFLHARLFNLGALTASPVKVDFYWANPALGLGAGNMHHLGPSDFSEYVEIPPRSSVDVRCSVPWVPEMLNNGHECVMVNCTNWLLDPITQPFQPTLDRHVGQRNLHVVEAKAGQVITFHLQVQNVFPLTMPATVLASVDHLRWTDAAERPALQDIGALAANFSQHEGADLKSQMHTFERGSSAHRTALKALIVERRTAGRSLPFERRRTRVDSGSIATHLLEPVGLQTTVHAGRDAGALLSTVDRLGPNDSCGQRGTVVQQFTLPPQTFRTLDVQIRAPEQFSAGDVVVTHLSHQAGPVTVGGYTVVMLAN